MVRIVRSKNYLVARRRQFAVTGRSDRSKWQCYNSHHRKHDSTGLDSNLLGHLQPVRLVLVNWGPYVPRGKSVIVAQRVWVRFNVFHRPSLLVQLMRSMENLQKRSRKQRLGLWYLFRSTYFCSARSDRVYAWFLQFSSLWFWGSQTSAVILVKQSLRARIPGNLWW